MQKRQSLRRGVTSRWHCWYTLLQKNSGSHFTIKIVIPCIGIPIRKIGQLWDYLIFIMGISILEMWHLYQTSSQIIFGKIPYIVSSCFVMLCVSSIICGFIWSIHLFVDCATGTETIIRLPQWYRDHFVYVLSQWETTLHCNIISHWLGT